MIGYFCLFFSVIMSVCEFFFSCLSICLSEWLVYLVRFLLDVLLSLGIYRTIPPDRATEDEILTRNWTSGIKTTDDYFTLDVIYVIIQEIRISSS